MLRVAAAYRRVASRVMGQRMGRDGPAGSPDLAALLVAARLGPPPERALISLIALNGPRVSEATGADIEHLGN